MKRCIIFIFCLIMACAPTLGACSCNDNQTPYTPVNIMENVTGELQETSDPSHSYSIKFTDKYMVKNGVSDYMLVIPADASDRVEFAKEELLRYFYEATGVRLPCVTDAGLTHTADNKYISLGQTALVQSAGVTVDKAFLGADGVRIVTKDNTVFLCGGGDDGVLYAAYTFLERLFDFDYFFTDSYSLDTGVKDVVLRDFDITDVPDIDLRIPNMGYLWNNSIITKRMRFSDSFFSGKIWVTNGEYGNNTHNSFVYLPPAWYNDSENRPEDYHPEWFASNNIEQLCYTAGVKEADRVEGDSYDLMVKTIFEVMKANLIKNTTDNFIFIGLQDRAGWCSCEACTESLRKYGANSASVILLCNKLNGMVKDWFATAEGAPYKRDLHISLLAYFALVDAPVVYDSQKGEYVATVKADPEIAVNYAPIEADFTCPLEDERNVVYYNHLQNWLKVCDNMMIWEYSTMYKDYMFPLNTFNSQQINYQLYKDAGTVWIFNQGQHNQAGGATGWLTLKTYLDSKWGWNVSLDYNTLVQRFFKGYFGNAYKEMLDIFDLYRDHWTVQESLGMKSMNSAYSSNTYKDTKYWSKQTLVAWLDMYDLALAEIEDVKATDTSKYNSLYKHITMERLSVYYLLVSFYGNTSLSAETNLWKQNFLKDVRLAGLTAAGETGSIDDVLKSWGVL